VNFRRDGKALANQDGFGFITYGHRGWQFSCSSNPKTQYFLKGTDVFRHLSPTCGCDASKAIRVCASLRAQTKCDTWVLLEQMNPFLVLGSIVRWFKLLLREWIISFKEGSEKGGSDFESPNRRVKKCRFCCFGFTVWCRRKKNHSFWHSCKNSQDLILEIKFDTVFCEI